MAREICGVMGGDLVGFFAEDGRMLCWDVLRIMKCNHGISKLGPLQHANVRRLQAIY